MPLIIRPTQPTAEDIADSLRADITQIYNFILPRYVQAYRKVWNNPAVKPEEIVAALGTDARELFQVSGICAQLLVLLGANNVPTTMPANYNYQENQDGSVVVAPKTGQ